jgi:hypothetical protein
MSYQEAMALQKKAPKYGNKITIYKGIKFRSKGECERYKQLELREIAGYVRNIKRQVKHNLISNGVKVGTYTSDFEYEEFSGYTNKPIPMKSTDLIWDKVIEDFKGKATPLFKLKWNIMESMPEFQNVKFVVSKGKRGYR